MRRERTAATRRAGPRAPHGSKASDARPAAGPGGLPPGGAPLGRGSLTWRYLGDLRGALLIQRTGVLQVMHPAIAAALIDHSDVFENPLGRLLRSAGPILGVVYDERSERTAHWVRERHPEIRGHGADGRRYHALDPAVFYWAHATFFEAQIATQELFGTPLSYSQKQRLYAESITWYARYGVTMRPVPVDFAAFERYWSDMIEHVLEPTSIARAAVRTIRDLPSPHPALAGPAWASVRPLVSFGAPWLVRGTLPEPAREKLGIDWGHTDELVLRALRHAVATAWPILPSPLDHFPRTRR